MIFNMPARTQQYATTPYNIVYYEPMHTWKVVRKYAYTPKYIWEYEDKSSVIHSMIPDDYRLFIRSNDVVWLDYYYQIEGWTRNSSKVGSDNKKMYFAVEEYWYLKKLL